MKSKFNNSPYASDAFGNNLRDEALKFQLDHEVAKEVKIKLNGNRYTFTLYSADGNVVGEDYFESNGNLISVELVPEKNFETQEQQTPGLRFHFENGQEIFCDFTHLHDKLVHLGEEDDYYKDEHIYGTKYFNGDQYFNDTIKANKEETNIADILTANIKDAKVETADILTANVDKANINAADVLTENVEKANIKTIDALNANIKSGNIEAVDVGTANITNGNIENETVNTAEIITANIGTANIDTLEARDVKLDEIDVRDAEVENAAINEEHTNHATIIRADIGSSGTGTADIQDANIYTKLSIKSTEEKDAELVIEPQAASKLETQPDFAALKINAAGKVISEDYTNTTDTPEETDSATFVYVDKVSTNSAGKIIENTSKIVIVAEGDAQGQFKLNNVNINVNNLGTDDRPSFTGLDSTDDVAISSDKLLKVDNIKVANGTENIASVDKTNHIINIGDATNDIHIKNDLVVDETAHITKDTTIGNNKIILDADAGNIDTVGKVTIEKGLDVNSAGARINGELVVNTTGEHDEISLNGPVLIEGDTVANGNFVVTGPSGAKIDLNNNRIDLKGDIVKLSILDKNKEENKVLVDGNIRASGKSEFDGSVLVHSGQATIDIFETDATKATFNSKVDINGQTNIVGNTSISGNITIVADKDNQEVSIAGPVHIDAKTGNNDYVNIEADEVNIKGPVSITATGLGEKIKLDGPVSITGNVDIVGPTGVVGTLTVNNNTTLRNNLRVDKNTEIGETLIVTGATTLDNTLDVSGATSLHNTLTVAGETNLNDNLSVTGSTSLYGTLTVADNTILGGTLRVEKETTLLDNLKVDANTISITGNTSFDGPIAATGSVDINGPIGVTGGDITIYGNVGVTGTLDVTEDTHLNSNLKVDQNTEISGVLSVTGATTLANTLSVSGSTTLHDTLTVNGETNLNNNLSVTGTTNLYNTLTVDDGKETTLGGTLEVKQQTILDSDLEVKANTQLDGNLSVTGTTVLADDLTINADETVNGNVAIDGAVAITADGSNEQVQITGPVGIAGDVSLNGDIQVTGIATIKDLTVIDNVIIPTPNALTDNVKKAVNKEYVDTKLNYQVHIEGNTDELSYEGNTITKKSNWRNLNTGLTGIRSEIIHLANDTTAGLMSHEDYKQIKDNTLRIEALEGTAVRISYEKADPSDPDPTIADIKNFAKAYIQEQKLDPTYEPTDADYTVVSVRTSFDNHIWNYYANNQAYRDDGFDTVTQFTNEIAGIIKGSPAADAQSNIINEGKVFAENDGTGSVIGWDTLKTRVTNVENTLSSSLNSVSYDSTNKKLVKTTNAGATTDIISLNTLKADMSLNNVDNTSDINKPISTATQTALNLKEDKSNKVTELSSSSVDDNYPSAKAVVDYVDSSISSLNIENGAGEGSLQQKGCTASGDYSFAEGKETIASNNNTHAEGVGTIASGDSSHAEGVGSVALGELSHAEGDGTTASGYASHAEGIVTVAGYDYQHVSGKYNDNKETTLLEVGNGSGTNNRSNAFEVYADGHAEVGSMGSTNKSVTTKEYADTNFVHKNSTAINSVYIVDNSGEQSYLNYAENPDMYTIPKRDVNGNIKTQLTPITDWDVASKKYVDTYGGKIDTASIDGINLPLNNKNLEIPTVRTDIDNQGLNSTQKTNAKTNLDLNNVVNTGDSAIPAENGTEKFTTGGAFVLKKRIDDLDFGPTGGDGKYIKLISQEDGLVAATADTFDTTISPTGTVSETTAPTTKAVKDYVEANAGTIRIIRVNGEPLIPDADKAVDITVPEVIDMR